MAKETVNEIGEAISDERLAYCLEAAHELEILVQMLDVMIKDANSDSSTGKLTRQSRAVIARVKTLVGLIQNGLGDDVVTDEQIKAAFDMAST